MRAPVYGVIIIDTNVYIQIDVRTSIGYEKFAIFSHGNWTFKIGVYRELSFLFVTRFVFVLFCFICFLRVIFSYMEFSSHSFLIQWFVSMDFSFFIFSWVSHIFSLLNCIGRHNRRKSWSLRLLQYNTLT